MGTISLKPERIEALEAYARRHGQAPVDALDEVVANYLAWEKQDFQETVEGIARGIEDVKAGRTKREVWPFALRFPPVCRSKRTKSSTG